MGCTDNGVVAKNMMELRIENRARGLGPCALKMGPPQRIGRIRGHRAMMLVGHGGRRGVNGGTTRTYTTQALH